MSVSKLNDWQADFIQQRFFKDLKLIFKNFDLSNWPQPAELSQLLPLDLRNFCDQSIHFSEPVNDGLYYEQRIYQHGSVETRLNNWHDFYNACIWVLFPKTKILLNTIHCDEMKHQKDNKRTAKRDAITHLDESGVIIVSNDSSIFTELREHQWNKLFLEKRTCWTRSIDIFIFGHGLYEKLLNPFIGLTAKAYPVKVKAEFFAYNKLEQYVKLDELLQSDIINNDRLKDNNHLTPLPLLGVPDWYEDNANPDFYQNPDYFRTKPNQLT